MSFNKIKVSLHVTRILSIIKGKTGLTPNIICRMALCLSISDPALPSTKISDSLGQEFNRFTLLGEMDSFFISILKERLIKDKLNPETDLLNQFRAHLERGIIMTHSRIKDLSDIYDLIPYSQENDNDDNKTNQKNMKIQNIEKTS